jgi:hypothetical protein
MNHIAKRIEENNLRKLDASEPFVFDITAIDIKRGKYRDPSRCIFSVAVRRVDPRCVGARVYKAVAWLEFRNGSAVRYIVPPTLGQAIYLYDKTQGKHAPEPGTYHFAAPSESVRLGRPRKDKAYKPIGKGNPKNPRPRRMAMHRDTVVRKFRAEQPRLRGRGGKLRLVE